MTRLLGTRLGSALRRVLAPAGPVSLRVSGADPLEIVARSPRGRAVGRIRVAVAGASARLSGLRVAPLWRGRGIGRALLDRACAEAAVRGAREATLAVSARNAGVRRLYEAAGFAARPGPTAECWARRLPPPALAVARRG